MKLLAEKVENVEEFNRCESIGFDYYQGYYISKPEVFEFISYTDVISDLKLKLS
jgi:c-di-GMP-related signal transduction protein